MKVPLLDLQAQLQYIQDELISSVTRVINSTRYIQGPEVISLEQEVADYCGTGYGVGVSSGTDALLVSLMALGVGQGDRVLTTPYSFFATMGVILRVGAIPVFADIDPETYNIDPVKVAEILESDNNRTIKAIIPVHLYGQCADMTSIMRLARHHDVVVIEDAAQAIGAEYNFVEGGSAYIKRAGTMGLCGCFSFFPSKNLGGIGDGGMVVTENENFAEKLVLMRNHGAYPKYYHKMVGGNFRLDPIQAAALRVKLPYLDGWHKKRATNASLYNSLFSDTSLIESEKIVLPVSVHDTNQKTDFPALTTHIYNQYIIRTEKRDALRDWLLANDIGCEIYYPVPLNQQECLKNHKSVSCPVAEKAANETLALPIYPELTPDMQRYVVEKIVQFYS